MSRRGAIARLSRGVALDEELLHELVEQVDLSRRADRKALVAAAPRLLEAPRLAPAVLALLGAAAAAHKRDETLEAAWSAARARGLAVEVCRAAVVLGAGLEARATASRHALRVYAAAAELGGVHGVDGSAAASLDALTGAARMARHRGDAEVCLAFCERARAIDGDDGRVLEQLLWALDKLGREDAADDALCEHAAAVATRDGNNALLLAALARLITRRRFEAAGVALDAFEAAGHALTNLGAAGLPGLQVYALEREQRRLDGWNAVARARGGDASAPQGGLFERGSMRFEVDVAEARVRAQAYTVALAGRRRWFTSFQARFPLPAGPRFRVRRRGLLSQVGALFGARDVVLGDDAFDHAFIVNCRDESATRAALDARARTALLERLPRGAEVRSDGQRVLLLGPGVWTDATLVDEAIEVTGALASVDVFGLSALRALPGRYRAASGPFDARLPPEATVSNAGAPVTLGPIVRATGGLATRAKVALPRPSSPSCTLTIDAAGTARPGPPDGLLTPRAAAALAAVSRAELRCGPDEAVLTWQHVEQDGAQLLAGVALLAALAGGGVARGVFR